MASGAPLPVRDLITAIADATGRPELVALGARPTSPNEPARLTADVARLRDEVGWTPRLSLQEAARANRGVVARGAAMTASVDVAIVAYRHWDLTRSCLEHLARQTVAARRDVCDNGCDEGTAELVAAEFPDVEVVRLERNMPYAVACNRAVANGSAELVVMMNNDVDVRPDFIERVVAPFAADPGARLGRRPCCCAPGRRGSTAPGW